MRTYKNFWPQKSTCCPRSISSTSKASRPIVSLPLLASPCGRNGPGLGPALPVLPNVLGFHVGLEAAVKPAPPPAQRELGRRGNPGFAAAEEILERPFHFRSYRRRPLHAVLQGFRRKVHHYEFAGMRGTQSGTVSRTVMPVMERTNRARIAFDVLDIERGQHVDFLRPESSCYVLITLAVLCFRGIIVCASSRLRPLEGRRVRMASTSISSKLSLCIPIFIPRNGLNICEELFSMPLRPCGFHDSNHPRLRHGFCGGAPRSAC